MRFRLFFAALASLALLPFAPAASAQLRVPCTPTLLNDDGITAVTGKGPIDAGFSFDDRFLFVLNAGDHSISAFSVRQDGSLAAVGTTSGLPAASNGLAAR